ncbi:FAD-dependent oxidoreductase [Modestobacter sp. SYSU DS0875]
MTPGERYDVVVVGGGAAGLSGALALSRARRSVLVVDAGSPRNAPAEHVHNKGVRGARAWMTTTKEQRWEAWTADGWTGVERSSPAGRRDRVAPWHRGFASSVRTCT